MRKVVAQSSKAEPNYEGPYTVVCRNAGGAYILRDKTGEIVQQKAPTGHLWLVSLEGNLSADSYMVERIWDHNENPDGTYTYLIKWSGYPLADAKWEPESAFYTRECILRYWETRKSTAPVPASPFSQSLVHKPRESPTQSVNKKRACFTLEDEQLGRAKTLVQPNRVAARAGRE